MSTYMLAKSSHCPSLGYIIEVQLTWGRDHPGDDGSLNLTVRTSLYKIYNTLHLEYRPYATLNRQYCNCTEVLGFARVLN